MENAYEGINMSI